MTGITEWQGNVGRNWADEHSRTDRSFAGLTPALLAMIAAEKGARIVDIGCGAGEVSMEVARARPGACVMGADISGDLVEVARARAGDISNLRFIVADAASETPQAASDLYISRHGVMFFPDPPAAFAHLSQAAAPHARIVFSCFRRAKENAWAAGIAGLMPEGEGAPADPFAPGPFAFADPDHVRRCLAGWRDVTFHPVDFAYVAGAGPDPVADAMAFLGRIGPAARAIRSLPDNTLQAFQTRLRALVGAHLSGGEVKFSAAAWIVTATADNAPR